SCAIQNVASPESSHSTLIRLLPPPRSRLCPYTTLFRSDIASNSPGPHQYRFEHNPPRSAERIEQCLSRSDKRDIYQCPGQAGHQDRKSTRLNSSHVKTSYAVVCLKKKPATLRARK